MLYVEISTQNREIVTLTAQRVSGGSDPDDLNVYKLCDGTFIKHRYGDGAMVLAGKMINHQLTKGKPNASN